MTPLRLVWGNGVGLRCGGRPREPLSLPAAKVVCVVISCDLTRAAISRPIMADSRSLKARQRALAEEQQALEEQVALLAEQQKRVAAELAEVSAALARGKSCSSGSQAVPPAKRRCQAAGTHPNATSAVEAARWRHLSEVQAEVTQKRASGLLVPFGAPGRVPRIYTDGCYDMMHSGHMNAVRQAKLFAESLGGVLVVGVHTDVEIEKNKGPPVMRDAERLALVSAVKWVDELVFDTPYSATLQFLDSIDADYVVHGDDISINADGTDAYGEARAAGRLKIIKRTEGVSTTDLVGRLLLLTRSHHVDAPPAPLAIGSASFAAASTVDALPPCDGLAATGYSSSGDVSVGGRDPINDGKVAEAKPSVPSASVDFAAGGNISTSGVSQFLATTWRLRQFSNGRVAAPDERIVYVDGCFDLLHAGHVAALYAARRLGDFLLVGLHDDATVNVARGQNQPICSLHERALCLLALGCVDEIILGAPVVVTADLMKSMNIHTVVGDADEPALSNDEQLAPLASSPEFSAETSPAKLPPAKERYAVPRALGKFVQGERAHPLCMVDIVRRIIENRGKYEIRNAKRERRERDWYENEKAYVEEL